MGTYYTCPNCSYSGFTIEDITPESLAEITCFACHNVVPVGRVFLKKQTPEENLPVLLNRIISLLEDILEQQKKDK